MKISGFEITQRTIGLKHKFKHASQTRESNDFVFFSVESKKHRGYGEALPRAYVTGETPESVADNLRKYANKFPSSLESLAEINDFLYSCESDESRNMASLCALDLALLDLYGKTKGKSVSVLLEEERGLKRKDIRITSGPIGLEASAVKRDLYILYGLKDIKLKVDPETSAETINRMGRGRLFLGLEFLRPRTLRLDGNCSFSSEDFNNLFDNEENPIEAKISYFEQPFPRNYNYHIRREMADESLISLRDARTIEFGSANIRVGKNGGILRTFDIINCWEKRNKEYMIGSLVGETSLLSTALMHVASHSSPLVIEGCYSTRMLKEDPCDKHVSLRFRGRVKFNYEAKGLGVNLVL